MVYKTENQTIKLEEVTESAIEGELQDEDITMKFIEVYSGLIQTNYVGLNHPLGFRHTWGKRYIDEIKCGDEVLYKATFKNSKCGVNKLVLKEEPPIREKEPPNAVRDDAWG